MDDGCHFGCTSSSHQHYHLDHYHQQLFVDNSSLKQEKYISEKCVAAFAADDISLKTAIAIDCEQVEAVLHHGDNKQGHQSYHHHSFNRYSIDRELLALVSLSSNFLEDHALTSHHSSRDVTCYKKVVKLVKVGLHLLLCMVLSLLLLIGETMVTTSAVPLILLLIHLALDTILRWRLQMSTPSSSLLNIIFTKKLNLNDS